MDQQFWLGAAAGAVILAVLIALLLVVTGKGRTGLGLKRCWWGSLRRQDW